MNAPVSLPSYLPDVLVLFEDVDLYPNTNSPFTWRVLLVYADPDNWTIDDVQLDAWGKGWITLPAGHALRAVLEHRTQGRDLRDQIDAAIIADMDQRGCAFDDGMGNAEHWLSISQLGVGR